MPDIIIKDAQGNDEVWENVNTVRFLENGTRNLISYKYDGGEAPTPEREDLLPAPDGMHWVGFLDGEGELFWNVLVDDGGNANYPSTNPAAPEDDMEFLRWNYSLEDLSVIKEDIVVGPVYKFKNFAENQTVMKFRKPSAASYNFSFYITARTNDEPIDSPITIQIDWGDSTVTTHTLNNATSNISVSHQYPDTVPVGQIYYIAMTRISGTGEWCLGSCSSSYQTANMYDRDHYRARMTSHPESLSVLAMQYGTDMHTINIGLADNSYYPRYLNILASELDFVSIRYVNYVEIPCMVFPPINRLFILDNDCSWFKSYSLQKITTIYVYTLYGTPSQTEVYAINLYRIIARKYGIMPIHSENYNIYHDYYTKTNPPYIINFNNMLYGDHSRNTVILPDFGVPYYFNYFYYCTSSSHDVIIYGDIVLSVLSTNMSNYNYGYVPTNTFTKIYGNIRTGTFSAGRLTQHTQWSYTFAGARCRKLYLYGTLDPDNVATAQTYYLLGQWPVPCTYYYIPNLPGPNNAMLIASSAGVSQFPYDITVEFGPNVTQIPGSVISGPVFNVIFNAPNISIGTYNYYSISYWIKDDTLVVSDKIQYLSDYCVFSLSYIRTVIIPESVSSIGQYFCNSCSKLTDVYIYRATPPTLRSTSSVFGNAPLSYLKVHVPQGSLSAYQSATNWSNFARYFVDDIEIEQS